MYRKSDNWRKYHNTDFDGCTHKGSEGIKRLNCCVFYRYFCPWTIAMRLQSSCTENFLMTTADCSQRRLNTYYFNNYFDMLSRFLNFHFLLTQPVRLLACWALDTYIDNKRMMTTMMSIQVLTVLQQNSWQKQRTCHCITSAWLNFACNGLFCDTVTQTEATIMFPVVVSRIWNSLPLHVTSAPSLPTFRRRGWSRFRSAAVSRPNLSFPITGTTLFSA